MLTKVDFGHRFPASLEKPPHPPRGCVNTGCSTPAFDSTAVTRTRNPKGPWFWLRAWKGAANPPLSVKLIQYQQAKSKTPSLHISWTTHLYFLTAATFQLSVLREVQHAPSKREYSVTSDNSSFRQTLLSGRLRQEKVL